MVNFIGEVRVDSAEVSGDPVIFHGLVNIGGDTTGITFSGDTVIVPDTVEFIEPFSDSLIITISGNTARITFPDTVIIAVDSTKPPSNPASTAVFGGARLTMRNYKSSSASRHEWTYYLLGGSKEQLSVWQGTQTSQSGFCGSTGGSQIYFYPEEYLTYAIEYPGIREDIPRLRLQPDGGIEYRITDHLGSNRVTLDGSGVVTNRYDYKPFGGILSSGGEARQEFNSREKDQESNLFNNGVRKLDDNIGRFTSIDPLWEKFPAWSPYVYSFNNPVFFIDPTGAIPTPMQGAMIAQHIYTGKVGDVVAGWTMTDLYVDPNNSGYRAGLYSRTVDGVTEYVMANAGSEFSLKTQSGRDDWSENVEQPFGGSEHISLSISKAKELSAEFGDTELTFVGHSKGGAEAAGNALATNRNALLYNPAAINSSAYGLDSKSYTGADENGMTAFIVKGDALNTFLNNWLAKPIDKVVYLPRQSLNPITNHGLDAIIQALREYENNQ